MRFLGKRVAITGAAGNLGQALGTAFGAEGGELELLDRVPIPRPPRVRALVNTHELDLLDEGAVRECFGRIGAVDVLCNVCGGFTMGTPVHETPAEILERMLDINVRTLMNAVRAAVPPMLEARRQAAIINVGARAGLAGGARMGAYSAAKSAVIRLTESMAAELGGHGIRVNCVLPSALDTPENRAAMPDADPSRLVAPAALADAITFLASEGARAVHGAALAVTGTA